MESKKFMKLATMVLFVVFLISGIQAATALTYCTNVLNYYSFEGNGTGVFENKCGSSTYDLTNSGSPSTVNVSGYNVTYSQSARNSATGTGYLTYSNSGDPSGAADFSVSFWFKPDSLTNLETIYGMGGRKADIRVINGNQLSLYANFGPGWLSHAATAALTDDIWQHVILTYDTTNGFDFFVDGVTSGTSAGTTGTILSDTKSSGILARDGTAIMDAMVDEFMIFNKELNSSEITNLYTCNDLYCMSPTPVAAGTIRPFTSQVLQITNVSINSLNYVNIFSGTIEVQNRTNITASSQLSVMGEAANAQANCIINFNDTIVGNGSSDPPNDKYRSIYIQSDTFERDPGNYTVSLQCKKLATGKFSAENGNLIINQYITPNGTSMNVRFIQSTLQVTSNTYVNAGSFNFTTSNFSNSSTLIRNVIIEPQVTFNYDSNNEICLRANFSGTLSDEFCRYGSSGNIGNGAFFWMVRDIGPEQNVTVDILLKGSTTDGNITINGITYETIQDKTSTNISESMSSVSTTCTSFTVLDSVKIESKDGNSNIYAKAGVSLDPTIGIQATYRISIAGEDGTKTIRDLNTVGQAGILSSQYVFPVIAGNYTVNLEGKVFHAGGPNVCSILGGSMIAYTTNNVDFFSGNYNITVNNSWNGTPLTTFNITTLSDNSTYSTTTGTITIPRSGVANEDLLIQALSYINKTVLNHDTLTNLGTTVFQSKVMVNATEIITDSPVFDFSLVTSEGTFSTLNGTVTLFPNIDSYVWNWTNDEGYFNKTGISFNVVSAAQNFTVINASDSVLNISAIEPFVSVGIENFTVIVTNTANNFTFSETANGLSVQIGLLKGLVYQINVSKTNFLDNVTNITVNQTLQQYEAHLAGLNNIFITFLDELTLENVLNVSFDVLSDVFSGSYNGSTSNNFSLIGIPTGTYEIRYGLDSLVLAPRSYYFRIPIQEIGDANLTLYTIEQNVSTLFIRTVLDQNSQPVENGLLEIQRPYTQLNNQSLVYRTVEIALIDSTGEAVFTAIPNIQAYRFRVLENLSILRTFTPSFLVNTDSELTVATADAVGQNFNEALGVSTTLFYNTTGDYYMYDFSDLGLVSSQFCLDTVQTFGSNTTLGHQCSSDKSGTIIILVNESLGSVTGVGTVIISGGEFVTDTDTQSFDNLLAKDLFKGVGITLYILLMIVITTSSAFVGIVIPIGLAIAVTLAFGLSLLGLFSIEAGLVGGMLILGIVILVIAKK